MLLHNAHVLTCKKISRGEKYDLKNVREGDICFHVKSRLISRKIVLYGYDCRPRGKMFVPNCADQTQIS